MDDAPSALAPTADSIDISLPLRTEHAATLRVVVASLGSDNGLSVDEIDDLKLAVSEVFNVLVDGASDAAPGRATVSYEASDGVIRLRLARGDDATHGDGEPIVLDALASTILSSVVDHFHVEGASMSLEKLAAERSSAAEIDTRD